MRIIKRVAESIGCLFAKLHLDKLIQITRSFITYTYTGFMKTKFKYLGQGAVVTPYMFNFKGGKYISIGENTVLGASMQLTAWDKYEGETFSPSITIGRNCNIRAFAHITAIDCIEIGDNLLTGTNVLITDNSHGVLNRENINTPPSKRQLSSKGAVKIGDNVWLGNNVIILPGVTIGSNVIIGANSVVSTDIPNNSVAVGMPAKVIKTIVV